MTELEQIWTDLRKLYKMLQAGTKYVSMGDVTEMIARMKFRTGTSEDEQIAHYQSEVYIAANELLIIAIRTSYPDVNEKDVMEVWYDCNESIAYCANVAKQYKADKTLAMMDMWSAKYIPE